MKISMAYYVFSSDDLVVRFILKWRLDLARGEWSVRSDFPSEGTPFYMRRGRR